MSVSTFFSIPQCLRALAFIGDLVPEMPAAQAAGPHAVPARVIATLARDLELLSRTGGIAAALRLIAARRGPSYPPALADTLSGKAAAWLAEMDEHTFCRHPVLQGERSNETISLELIADLIDLQQPWLGGHSRRVAMASRYAAGQIGLDEQAQQRCYRAGLIHGIGRGAVPGELWNAAGPLSPAAHERLRLAPYWTLRALRDVDGMAVEAEIASYIGERLDGSGNFRGAIGATMSIESQVLAASSAWIALQSVRPWRAALPVELAGKVLAEEAAAGRFHPGVVDALRFMPGEPALPATGASGRISLSEREADVLRAISRGHTNKEVARQLGISPRTVGTHVESAFRKLNCTTRAAAALKALTLRLI
jgi:HD-GYP domain-containing protein (c-di-GMP phosphodiesterase class II)